MQHGGTVRDSMDLSGQIAVQYPVIPLLCNNLHKLFTHMCLCYQMV